MNKDELDAVRTRWSLLCGACDGGLPQSCTHPAEDPRGVILQLCDALAEVTAERDEARQTGVAKDADITHLRRELSVAVDLRKYLDAQIDRIHAELAIARERAEQARGAVLQLGDAIIRANGWEPQNGVTVELSTALERLVVERDLLRESRDGWEKRYAAMLSQRDNAIQERAAARERAEQAQAALELLGDAWVVIANADGWNWDTDADLKWRAAAEKWRDNWHAFAGGKAAAPQVICCQRHNCSIAHNGGALCCDQCPRAKTDEPKPSCQCIEVEGDEFCPVHQPNDYDPVTGRLVPVVYPAAAAPKATCLCKWSPVQGRIWCDSCAAARDAVLTAAAAPQADEPLPTITESEAERLANLRDCLGTRNGGLHCQHYQEGDGDCCDCGRPNYCPDGGVVPDPDPQADDEPKPTTLPACADCGHRHRRCASKTPCDGTPGPFDLLCDRHEPCPTCGSRGTHDIGCRGPAHPDLKDYLAGRDPEPLPVAAPDPADTCGLVPPSDIDGIGSCVRPAGHAGDHLGPDADDIAWQWSPAACVADDPDHAGMTCDQYDAALDAGPAPADGGGDAQRT